MNSFLLRVGAIFLIGDIRRKKFINSFNLYKYYNMQLNIKFFELLNPETLIIAVGEIIFMIDLKYNEILRKKNVGSVITGLEISQNKDLIFVPKTNLSISIFDTELMEVKKFSFPKLYGRCYLSFKEINQKLIVVYSMDVTHLETDNDSFIKIYQGENYEKLLYSAKISNSCFSEVVYSKKINCAFVGGYFGQKFYWVDCNSWKIKNCYIENNYQVMKLASLISIKEKDNKAVFKCKNNEFLVLDTINEKLILIGSRFGKYDGSHRELWDFNDRKSSLGNMDIVCARIDNSKSGYCSAFIVRDTILKKDLFEINLREPEPYSGQEGIELFEWVVQLWKTLPLCSGGVKLWRYSPVFGGIG